MIWSTIVEEQKSQFVFMPKDQCFAKDFVEVVYNGKLPCFMGRMPYRLLMEDGTPIHVSKLCEEWR